MLPSVLKSWRVPTLQVPIKAFRDGLQTVSKDNFLSHIHRYLTADLQAGAVPPSQSVSVRPASNVLKGSEYLYFWDKLKKCFGFGSKKEGKGKSKSGKKTKKQSCNKSKGKCGNKKATCLKKKEAGKCETKAAAEKAKPDCKPKETSKKDAKKADPCKKEETKKDPCKKDSKTDVKKADPCKKDQKKDDPCKKKEEKKKEDPCKKKEEKKKDDPCKKKDEKKKDDPCKKDQKKDDPCKKKEQKKEDPCKKKDEKKKDDPCKKKDDKKKDDPCKKKDEKKKDDPCKKKEDPCKKKDEKKDDPCKKKDSKKDDPCKKKDDPCKKKDDPCKKQDDPCKKKDDPCKTKDDPCKKKDDPCKKKDEKKDDPCKKKDSKKDDPCKKKDEKKDDPCKKKDDPCKKKDDPCKKKEEKKDDPCKKKDPCGDKFVSNEFLEKDPILLFSITQTARKKEEELNAACKDPCAAGACDVLPGQDEPCGSSLPWKVKVNPCRQKPQSSKARCSSTASACIIDAKAKKEEKLVKGNDCGVTASPCGKRLCPNRCEVKKKRKFSSLQEAFDLGIFNFVNALAAQAVGILSIAVNFASQRGSTPIGQAPPQNQPGSAGSTPSTGVAQKVSGIIGKIKGFWNGPEEAAPSKEKQRPRTSNVPPSTPGRSAGRYPTRQRCEGLETKPNGDFGFSEESGNLTELPPDNGFVFVGHGLPQDDFEKCEDSTPPCPIEIETMPCPKKVEDCEKTSSEDIWSDIDDSYGYERFPFKKDLSGGPGNTPEVAALSLEDPSANHQL